MCTYILFLVQEDCKWGTLLWTEVLIAFCSCRGSCCGILPLAKWWYSLVIHSSICLWSIRCAELLNLLFWSSTRFYLLPKAQVRKTIGLEIGTRNYSIIRTWHSFQWHTKFTMWGDVLYHFASPLRKTYPVFNFCSCCSSNSFHSLSFLSR